MPNWKRVIVSGSDAALNSLNITTSLTASGNIYPTGLGVDRQVLKTDGAGNITFGYPEEVISFVKNVSGGTLLKGTPVHATASGAMGNVVGIIAASASDATTMPATFVLNETLADEAEGEALSLGFIQGVNTSGFEVGDVVYVGELGGYTNIKPTGSNLIQNLGIVTKVDAVNGSGFVLGAGRSNDLPNITPGHVWVGNSNSVPVVVLTSSLSVASASFTPNAIVTASISSNTITFTKGNGTTFPIVVPSGGGSGSAFPYTGSAQITGSLGVTGSFSVYNQNANYTVLDTNTGTFRGTNTSSSINWIERVLNNTSGQEVLSWRTLQAKDSNTSQSIHWGNRRLTDNYGTIAADWSVSGRELYDRYTTASIDWDSRRLTDNYGTIAADWSVSGRELYDRYTTASINWDQRALSDSSGNTSVDWEQRILYDQTAADIIDYSGIYGLNILNSRPTIEAFTLSSQDEFTQNTVGLSINSNFAGKAIQVATNIDLAVTASNNVFLDTDGVWKLLNQTTDTTTKLLGICVDPYPRGAILTEGIITVTTSSGYTDIPFVSGSSFYGMPVYLTGSMATLTTDTPTSGYVRAVGHMYYNSATTPDYWIMKFNPSNDWYQI
jgi:hypothetical protein